jgi:hypothetical protein
VGKVLQDIYGVAVGNRTFGQLGQSIKRVPMASVAGVLEGGKIIQEYAVPTIKVAGDMPANQLPTDPGSRMAQVAYAMEKAGARVDLEFGLKTTQIESMKKDYYSGENLKAYARSPLALVEYTAKPIQEIFVPRMKVSVFAEKVNRILEMNPNKTMDELGPQFSEAWNGVDATMGQVVYDRYFMRNVAKNVIQAIIRAPGWTGGTLAWVGGAPMDAAKFISEWARTGKAPENIPPRVAYTVALFTMIALTNGVMTYALTGDKPKGTDFWAFRDGGQDAQGNPTRWLLPSYAKDIFNYWKAPGHTVLAKTHPLISLIGDMVKNRNYYGEEIANKDDSFIQQQIDRGTFALKTFTPFWMAGAGKASEAGGGTLKTLTTEPQRILAPLAGIMPATRAYTATDAQQVMDEYNKLNRPEMTTKQVQEEKRLKKELRELAVDEDKAGFQDVAREAVEKGTLTKNQIKAVIEASQVAPGLGRFVALPVEWMVKAWKAATPEEKEVWGPAFLKKVAASSLEIKIRNRNALIPILREMDLDPYADALENLAISEKGSTFKLAGLGVRKPVGEMADMDTVSTGLLKELSAQEAKLGTEATRKSKKTNKYSFLGIQ